MLLHAPAIGRRSALLGAVACAAPARAEGAWPARPIRWVVPYPPGVGTETALLLSPPLSRHLGQPLVVDSRPGATGTVGAGLVARAAPDGYTLLMATQASHAIVPHVLAALPYDPLRDFAPVGIIVQAPAVLVARRGLGVQSLPDVIEMARSRQVPLSYASGGIGSSQHLAGEILARAIGAHLTHVPYRGLGPAAADTIAGVVDLMFTPLPMAVEPARSGLVQPLAVAAEARVPQLPAVPSFAEAGLPEVRMDAWFGLLAPAGTPEDRVRRLNAALNETLSDPALAESLVARGYTPLVSTPEEFAARVAADLDRFGRLVEALALGRR